MKYAVLAILFCFGIIRSSAQSPVYVFQGEINPDNRINIKDLHPWKPKQSSEYSGIYHFGDSEWEWDLLIIVNDSVIVAQGFSNEWGKTDLSEKETWRKQIVTYPIAEADLNRITTNALSGYFMEYKTSGDQQPGMIIPYNFPKLDTMEFGGRTSKDIVHFWFFTGDYPELSWKIQDDSYFAAKTPEQLQIMLNEIYARYGQRFAKNGKMYHYFKAKNWYKPFRDNVQSSLTAIEIRNIAKINARQNKP